jgi:hypothetical protein
LKDSVVSGPPFTKSCFIAAALFVLLTAIFTFPAVWNLDTLLFVEWGATDPLGVVWDLWWQGHAFVDGLDLYQTDFLGHPDGVNFGNIPHPALQYGLGTLFAMWFGEIASYNLMVLSSFPLAALSMFALAWFVTRSPGASLLAGFAYGFSPFHFAHAFQHLGIAQVQWLPLVVLGLLLLMERVTWKRGLFFAVVTAVNFHFDFYHGYMGLLICGLFLVFVGYRRLRVHPEGGISDQSSWEDRHPWLIIAAAVLLIGLLLLPTVLPVLHQTFLGPDSEPGASFHHRPFRDLMVQSARPLGYLLPSLHHPLMGGPAKFLKGSVLYGQSDSEHVLYLGWAMLFLAWAGVRWSRRKPGAFVNRPYTGWFVFLGLSAFLISLPPVFDLGVFKIYFPSFWLYKILPMFRAYARFGVVVLLAVCVLGAIGLRALMQERKGAGAFVWRCALVLFAIFEFVNIPPFHVYDIRDQSGVYAWLKEQPDDVVVCEYPMSDLAQFQVNQRIHQKPLVNDPTALEATGVLNEIKRLQNNQVPGILASMGVRYCIVHLENYRNNPVSDVVGELPDFERVPGLKKIRSFEGIDVYEVTANSTTSSTY